MLSLKVLLLGKKSKLKEAYFRKLLSLAPEEVVDIANVDFHTVTYSPDNMGDTLDEPFTIQLINVPDNVQETPGLATLYAESDYFVFSFDENDEQSKRLLEETLLPQVSQKVLLSKENYHISCVYNALEKEQALGLAKDKRSAIDTMMVDINQDGKMIRQQFATALKGLMEITPQDQDELSVGAPDVAEKKNKQYEKYWDKTKSVQQNMIALLYNYVNGDYYSGALFHRGRHHTALASTLVGQLTENKITEVDAFNALADTPKDSRGSLQRRVDFLRTKLTEGLNLHPGSLHMSIFEEKAQEAEENKGWLRKIF